MMLNRSFLIYIFCFLFVKNLNCLDDSNKSLEKSESRATVATNQEQAQNFSFHLDNSFKNFCKVRCLLLCIGNSDDLFKLSKVIRFDLEFTDQLEVDINKSEHEPTPDLLPKLFKKGTSLCLFIKDKGEFHEGLRKRGQEVEVIVKEPSLQSELLRKRYIYAEDTLVADAHEISSEILPFVTGEKGPMISSLAFTKQISENCKAICVSDYSCKREKVIYSDNRITVAPRWHSRAPVVFFSQFTNVNNRLLSVDLRTGKQKVICSYDGLNMQPSFSQDGIKAVLCLSGRGNSELYMYDQQLCNKLRKRVFEQLTNNRGNNTSPCLLENGDVIFCSDFETGFPQIYYREASTKLTHRLTNGRGYCAAPSYNAKNNSVVYCRFVKGAFQLFMIDLGDKKRREKQLTFDFSDKQEPAWSPCGKYIVFSCDQYDPAVRHRVPQIAILNMLSRRIHVMTTGSEPKSFPHWTTQVCYK